MKNISFFPNDIGMTLILRAIMVSTFMIVASLNAQAQLSEEELAKIAQNPLANLISLPFQNSINTGIGPHDRTQNILKFQPVVPFADGKIIVRAIVPYVSQPDILGESGSNSGFSDVNLTAFYVASIGEVKVGFGPIINFPTAEQGLGAKEWGLGPSVVAVVKPGNFVMGALVNNVWSVESDQVNNMLIQLFINYNLPNGTYLTTAPAITANWKAHPGNKWTVPVGMGIGKVMKVGGKIPLNVQAGAYYNVKKPQIVGEDWSFKFGATLLLPTAIFKKE